MNVFEQYELDFKQKIKEFKSDLDNIDSEDALIKLFFIQGLYYMNYPSIWGDGEGQLKIEEVFTDTSNSKEEYNWDIQL